MEAYQYGPIRLERYGKIVSITSSASDQDIARFRERSEKARPKLKRTIEKKIHSLTKTVRKVDPVHLLGELTIYNLVIYGQQESTSEYVGPAIVDYVLSIALASKMRDNVVLPDEKDIDKVQNLARDIILSSSRYFVLELVDASVDKPARDLRVIMMQRQLLSRGDAYAIHELDTVIQILQPLDDALFIRFGFRSEDVRKLIETVQRQFRTRLEEDACKMAQIKTAHELFKDYCSTTNLGKGMSEEQFRAGYEELPAVKALLKDLRAHSFSSGPELCKVIPTNAQESCLVNQLSCQFGDNGPFLNGDRNGWPSDDTITANRLFIKHDTTFYCFARHALIYHLRDSIENVIQESAPGLFAKRYEPARNAYLEGASLSYITNALPGCKYYGNLYYTVLEQGVQKRCELDGLIMFDTALILIEAKAGALSVSARRGSIPRLRHDIAKLIDKPFDQCLRARQYIGDNSTSVFYDKNNNEICSVDRTVVNEVFLITVTLDSLGPISGDLNTVRKLGLAVGSEWFWSVAIHDLRVISELAEFPSQFLHYLQRRLRINTQPAIKSIDEVDLFGVYIESGLYFEDSEIEGTGHLTFNGYTDTIDDYYYRTEVGQTVEMPRQIMPKAFKELILKIERTQKRGFSEVAAALLDMDGVSREEFAKLLEERVSRSSVSRKRGNFSMFFNNMSYGVTVVTEPSISPLIKNAAIEYCKRKQSERALKKWYGIILNAGDSNYEADFVILR